jgi:hypothetical protein
MATHIILDFPDQRAEEVADRIATDLFRIIFECANRQYPWRHPVTASMEALAEEILNRARLKFYERCSG